jgi:peptidoglycan hydrolase-like protein with peptidoglycan-binding domain
VAGRGAWPSNGLGGTLSSSGTGPGRFYRLPATGTNYIGKATPTDVNMRAVKGAVVAYQNALSARLGISLTPDGVLGPITASAIEQFQTKIKVTVDGVIGPETSKRLVCPDMQSVVWTERLKYPGLRQITPQIVCGTIQHESAFDAGAVGAIDDNDIGIAQINGPAWPDYTEAERLDPKVGFKFIYDYYRRAVNDDRINTIEDAIASYNLGVGGASRWISQGRPEEYYPPNNVNPRYVWNYIDSIKGGCAIAPR